MSSTIILAFRLQVENDSEVKSKFDSVGDSVGQLGEKTDKAAEKADKVKVSFTDAATTLSNTTEKAFSLFTQFDNLEKIELRIAQAEKNVDSARTYLIQSQSALDKLVSHGITTGSEYEAAQLRVKAAQEGLSIAQDKVALSQGDLSEAQFSFATSVVPASIDIISGLSKGLQQLGLVTKITNLETGKSKFDFSTATLSMTAHRIATGASTLATQGLTLATKLFHLAMGPVGAIILGVTAFLAIFATNSFGVRDAINSMGKAIGDALPFLKPLLDALSGIANTIFPEAKDQAQDFGATAANSLQQVQSQIPGLTEQSQVMESGLTSNYQTVAEQAGAMQVSTTASFASLTKSTDENVSAQSAAFKVLDAAARDAGISVSKSLSDMARSAESAADRVAKAAAKAAAALRSLGLAKSQSGSGIQTKAAATGFSGIVTEPTLFLAGEAGPERVNIAPTVNTGVAGSSRPIMITVVTELDGRQVARTVSRAQAENI